MDGTVADLILKILASHGVKHIFGVIGDAVFPLAAALARQERIRYFPAAIENGAALMAAYSAKLTGELGVCIGTSGPGAAGLLNGTADAFLDGAPLLCLTGQVPLNKLGTHSKQSVQPGRLYAAVTAQSRLCAHPAAAAPELEQLIRIALEQRTAVHLEIPKDILGAPVKQDFTPYVTTSATFEGSGLLFGDLAGLTTAVTQAQKPILVLGKEAKPIVGKLAQLVDQWGAGIVLTQEAKGLLPDSFPQVVGGIGPVFLPECWHETDFILLIGTGIYEIPFFPPAATVWQVNNAIYAPDTAFPEIRGDLQHIVSKLEELPSPSIHRSDWRNKIAAAHQSRMAVTESAGGAPLLHPVTVAKVLAELTKPDAIITLDVGEFGQWFNLGFMADRQTVLHSTTWRGMGNGIPAAIAACLHAPGQQVIALVGDGGFLMSLPELNVIAANKLPLTIIVFRNQCYGLEEHKMKKEGFPVFGTGFALPDLLKLAESFSLGGYRPAAPDQCGAVLQQALANPPALVEVGVSSPDMPYL